MYPNLNLLNSSSSEFEVLVRSKYLPLPSQAPPPPSSSSSSSSSSPVKGKAQDLPHLGPRKIDGDILDDPELLWAELDFNEQRVAEAQEKLREQASSISSSSAMNNYWKNRYKTQANMYWHEFYKRNSNNFYKDRHYLHVVFPELLEKSTDVPSQENCLYLCEVGAGVRNYLYLLMYILPLIFVF